MLWDLSEERALVAVHQPSNIHELSEALFSLVRSRLAHKACFLTLRPLEFELPGICSHRRYRKVGDDYIRHHHRHDLWLKRSPVNPSVRVVRHSDYTPLSILKRSLFYRHVLRPFGASYGASIVAWRGDVWLATLTLFRSLAQGDFTDAELALLHRWHLHFEAAIKRVAARNENRMQDRSLAVYISSLPNALILLDWNMTVISHNPPAARLCSLWRRGATTRNRPRTGRSARLNLPLQLRDLVQSLRPRIEKKKTNRPGPYRMIRLAIVQHRDIHGLWAEIAFIPSKMLSFSRGLFIVTLHHEPLHSPDRPRPIQLAQLTPQEREVARRAALGQTNLEIADALGKSANTVKTQLSSIFRKLKLRSKTKLAAALTPLRRIRPAGK